METASEFLRNKGFRKVYQPSQRYNVTISEMVEFLDEYSSQVLKDFIRLADKKGRSTIRLRPSEE